MGDDHIVSVVALRAKMYSVQTTKGLMNKAKGVKKSVVKGLTHEEYEHCVTTGEDGQDVNFNMIQQKNHEIYTVNKTKKCLSSKDDKRNYTDNIHSLAHGYIS